MERYSLEIVDRHMVAHLDGGLALVDTGSPFSIGRGRPIPLLGLVLRPSDAQAGTLDAATQDLGLRLEWLLGNDILGRAYVALDWAGGTVAFSTEPPSLDGVSIPVIPGGVPIIEIEFAEESQPVFLDTGAKLSYASAAAVAGLAPIRRERDFSPIFGTFHTEVFAREIRVGGRSIRAELGVLPADIRAHMPSHTGGWVLGSDFFRDRVVVLDYAGGRLIYAPPVPPRWD